MNMLKKSPIQSKCKCGQAFLIEENARTCRADGKRIFYPGVEDDGWCAFRCRNCSEVVSESVPGAEYGEPVPQKELPMNLWVAEDPTQPGTAFATASTRHDATETLEDWQRMYGVKGRMVNRDDALMMLDSWDRSKSELVKISD